MLLKNKNKKYQRGGNRNFLCLASIFCSIVQLLCFFGSCDRSPAKKQILPLKKELEIGLIEGDENYIFGLIADIEVDASGNIYVLDSKMNNVAKYDRDGRFVLRFGRRGVGPGELENPRAIALDSSNRIYVLDFRKVESSTIVGAS